VSGFSRTIAGLSPPKLIAFACDVRALPHHFLQFRSDQSSTDDTDTKLGFNTGGGIEYFLNRTLAVKGEVGDAEISQRPNIQLPNMRVFGSWITNTPDQFLCIIQATDDASGRSRP
jgi:hypothetical protein